MPRPSHKLERSKPPNYMCCFGAHIFQYKRTLRKTACSLREGEQYIYFLWFVSFSHLTTLLSPYPKVIASAVISFAVSEQNKRFHHSAISFVNLDLYQTLRRLDYVFLRAECCKRSSCALENQSSNIITLLFNSKWITLGRGFFSGCGHQIPVSRELWAI